MPNGNIRQANLQMLFERAKQYETANFKGLFNFINFIEKLKTSSGDMSSAKIIGENDNVVRIMSIHKSKGLEFPIVFLSNTGKQFNLTDLNKNLILHQDLGIGVKYINYERQIQFDTLSKSAVKDKVFKETLSEEMRILYVALTRAKEKLYIIGIKNNYEKQIEKLINQIERYKKSEGKINPILIKKYIKYIDWILLVYFYNKLEIEKYTELKIYNKKQVLDFCERPEEDYIDIKSQIENKDIDEEQIQKIAEKLNKKYDYELSTKIPTKTSVTKLKQNDNKIEVNFNPPKFTKMEENTKLTGEQKGTLLHLCLQKLDINTNYDLDKIKELINNLVSKEIISKIEAENINPKAILDFTYSNIWKEMKLAKQINREKPFYITIPAKDIYKEEVQENILVQGIIDLYYINQNNEIVLVDYKTDLVQSEEELTNKYKLQLELYKKALESALNKKVCYVYIYSTYLKREIQIY